MKAVTSVEAYNEIPIVKVSRSLFFYLGYRLVVCAVHEPLRVDGACLCACVCMCVLRTVVVHQPLDLNVLSNLSGHGQPTLTAASAASLQPTFAAAPSYVINSQDPYSIGIPIAGTSQVPSVPSCCFPASM